jgi:hypothetical protein
MRGIGCLRRVPGTPGKWSCACEGEKIVDAQSDPESQEHTDDQRPDTHNLHHSQRIRESLSNCEFDTDFSESQQEWFVRKSFSADRLQRCWVLIHRLPRLLMYPTTTAGLRQYLLKFAQVEKLCLGPSRAMA